MSHSWTHPWCKSPSRDEAFRAAEDNRPGPLPTLEEAIAAVTERRPVDAGGGGNVTGLRTERVTLEVTHDLDAPLGEWIAQVIDESLGYDEHVLVVEETHFDDLAQVAMERDAAIRERDTLRGEITSVLDRSEFASTELTRLRNRVAALEGHIVQRDAALESVVDRAATADKRVASLESQLESVADRAAAAETALESAAIFIHAHSTGNSVPPHIEAKAVALLKEVGK